MLYKALMQRGQPAGDGNCADKFANHLSLERPYSEEALAFSRSCSLNDPSARGNLTSTTGLWTWGIAFTSLPDPTSFPEASRSSLNGRGCSSFPMDFYRRFWSEKMHIPSFAVTKTQKYYRSMLRNLSALIEWEKGNQQVSEHDTGLSLVSNCKA